MLKFFKAIDVFGRNIALCSVCTLKAKFNILYLCAKCVSVDSLVVFYDRKWRTPDDILKQLQEFGDFGWTYSRTIESGRSCKDLAKEKPPGYYIVIN